MTFGSPQISLYTDDVERLRLFYASLGFQETSRHPQEGATQYVELALDGFTLGIADVQSAARDHGLHPELGRHRIELVLTSDNTDANHARLTAAGAPSLSAPHDWLTQSRVAWIADPDGNPIRLVQQKSSAMPPTSAPATAATSAPATTPAPATPPVASNVTSSPEDDLDLPQSPLPAGYYTADGTPTFDAVAERIHQRSAVAEGDEIMDGESERGRHENDDLATLKRAGQDRLAQLRKSMGLEP